MKGTLRHDLPPLPSSWRALPVDHRGYPVPRFVARVNGAWDFRVADPRWLAVATREHRCWLCGTRLTVDANGRRVGTFVIGPMCGINRTSSEPPSHPRCARYAAQVCPFLVRPRAKRRDLPTGVPVADPAGEMLTRNPGVTLLWSSASWKPTPVSPAVARALGVNPGMLFDIGEPLSVEWFAEGRQASREEIAESVESGLPRLSELAEKEGAAAVLSLEYQRAQFEALFP